MNNNNQGFMLIECMIYFCLLVIVTSLTCKWAFITNGALKIGNNKCLNHMSTLAAQDFVIRLLRSTPAQKKSWKKIDFDHLVWIAQDTDMGLYKDENKLFFVQGSYNDTLHEWRDSHKSLISESVNNLSFTITSYMKYGIEWIKNIEMSYNDAQFVVAISNGVL